MAFVMWLARTSHLPLCPSTLISELSSGNPQTRQQVAYALYRDSFVIKLKLSSASLWPFRPFSTSNHTQKPRARNNTKKELCPGERRGRKYIERIFQPWAHLLFKLYRWIYSYLFGADCLDFQLTAKLNDIQLSDVEG